jgi:hypothetical protein
MGWFEAKADFREPGAQRLVWDEAETGNAAVQLIARLPCARGGQSRGLAICAIDCTPRGIRRVANGVGTDPCN